MLPNQKSFELSCKSCGKVSHITTSSLTLPAEAEVRCPSCGASLGLLGDNEVEIPSRTDVEILDFASANAASSHGRPRRRASSLVSLERRGSNAVVKPFLGQISAWQDRSAYLRACLAVGEASTKQRFAMRIELGQLRKKVPQTLEAVRAVAQGATPDGRVRDVVLALDRLAEQLTEALSLAGEDMGRPEE